jgi:hypothetical protein
MLSRHLGGAAVLALGGLLAGACASGEGPAAPPDAAVQHDAAPGVDATAPTDGPLDAAPVQTDAPAVTDAPADAPAATDAAPLDGAVQPDATSVPDGGCQVQNLGPCDPVCQNCGSGKKCTLDLFDAGLAKCLDNGTVQGGAACTQNSSASGNVDDCVAGNLCLNSGTCMHFCRADGDCPSNGACLVTVTVVSGDAGVPSNTKVCRSPDTCDPMANTGCTTPKGCLLFGNDTQTFCLTHGTGTDGVGCTYLNDCQAGFMCMDESGVGVCRKLCRIAAPSCPSYTCQGVQGFTLYGVCTP